MSYQAGAPLCGDASKANATARRQCCTGVPEIVAEAGR